MTATIVTTHILADNRTPGAEGLVIADFEYNDGVRERCIKSVPSGEDAATNLSSLIAGREQGRVRSEILANLREIVVNGPDAQITLNASTASDNATFIREHYAQAEKGEAIAVGAYFNTFSDAQLKSVFGITQTQLDNTLRPKISRAATLWADLKAEAGA